MTDSIDTSEAEAKPWAPDSQFPPLAVAAPTMTITASHDPFSHLRAQILVLASLLGEALNVVKNVDAEGGDEGGDEAELLQHLITQGDAAVAAVMQEHGMGRLRHG